MGGFISEFGDGVVKKTNFFNTVLSPFDEVVLSKTITGTTSDSRYTVESDFPSLKLWHVKSFPVLC
jgi:hypothetical protein